MTLRPEEKEQTKEETKMSPDGSLLGRSTPVQSSRSRRGKMIAKPPNERGLRRKEAGLLSSVASGDGGDDGSTTDCEEEENNELETGKAHAGEGRRVDAEEARTSSVQ